MALTDKNIVITPNKGQSADPQIVFSGASDLISAQNIILKVYPADNGTLSFEGSAGQLFSIGNSMTGTIYSINDVSGIPSLEVIDTGLVKLAEYSGNVILGTGVDNVADKLQVNGSVSATQLKSTVATGTAPLTVASTTVVTNLNADKLDGQDGAYYQNASNINAGTLAKERLPGTIDSATTGNAATATKVSGGAPVNGDADLVTGTMGGNDFFRIRVGGGPDAGWVELATADNGNEPIYVRQYSDQFGSVARTLTLLDASGNTVLPGLLQATKMQLKSVDGGFGEGNGDAASSSANNVKISSWFGIGFSPSISGQPVPYGEYSHWFNTRNGDMGIRGTLTAPTFSGALSGNAATATTLQTARTINGISFNGSANITVEPYIEQDTSTDAARYLTFVDSTTAGHQRLNLDTTLSYNPSTNILATTISGTAAGLTAGGDYTALTGTTKPAAGLYLNSVYNNGYPITYGKVLRMSDGNSGAELLLGWSDLSTSTAGYSADNYIRSVRDTAGVLWSPWAKIYTDANSSTITSVGTLTSGVWSAGGISAPYVFEDKIALAASAIDVSTGGYFTKTITAATIFTVTGAPAAGNGVSFILDLTNAGAYTITWWSGVKWGDGGTAPVLTASGRDSLAFFTHDGGTTWTGVVLGLDIK